MASARINVTIRLHIPPMDEWQARLARAWLGPVAVNAWTQMGPRQLTRHAYPGQASQRAVRVPVRCTCWYWWHEEQARWGEYRDPIIGSAFKINPLCPHHGNAAYDR